MATRLANRRIRLVFLALGALLVAALGRAAWLQTVRADELNRTASANQEQVVETAPKRGTIFDAAGRELAIAERAITVYVDPRTLRGQIEEGIVDPDALARQIAAELELDPAVVAGQLADTSSNFVRIARKVDPDRAEALRAALDPKLVGIGFLPEDKRIYPQRKLAAAVVGRAGIENEGRDGLELAYEKELAGEVGRRTVVRDPASQTIGVRSHAPVREGADLHLTLDHTLQAEVQRILRRTRADFGAKAVSAVVLDVRTGGVLAMASEPGFDANDAPAGKSGLARNHLVTDLYEPGSTMKALTVAAALEEGATNLRRTYMLPPELQVSTDPVWIIREAHPRGLIRASLADIVAESWNVGVVTIARSLGPKRFRDWLERFGLGKPTGIDFPGESAGLIQRFDDWTDSTLPTNAIGQGIAVTPIQMASIYQTIANDGVRVTPHLVSRIEGGETVTVVEPERRRVLTKATARTMRRLLAGVVSRGTAPAAQVAGYTVAGKTGTANIPKPGGYFKGRYIASFVGFVPAREPRLVILVKVDEPRWGRYGGVVAAPAFSQIATYAVRKLEIPPDIASGSA